MNSPLFDFDGWLYKARREALIQEKIEKLTKENKNLRKKIKEMAKVPVGRK